MKEFHGYSNIRHANTARLAPRQHMATGEKGVIKWFNRKTGIGFVSPEAGGDDVFLHQSHLSPEVKRNGTLPALAEGDSIYYDIGEHNMRPIATNVQLCPGHGSNSAAAVDVPAAEAAYIARLVAHLRGKPQVNLAQLGHNVVSKPDGAPSLGTVLRQHPEVFSQHRVGTSITVSLVSGAAAPSQPKGRKSKSHAEVEPADLAAAIKDALQEAEKEQVEQNEQIEEARRSYFESQRQREADDRVTVDSPHSSDSEQMYAFVCTVVELPPPPTLVLKSWHGTSWASAQTIKSRGFKVSSGEKQLLGRGVYVAKFHKALRFAQDESRHHSPEGGLVECQVSFSNPKFVTSDDDTWQSEGHDACRADHTSGSSHLEWCLKEASQVS